MDRFKVTLDRMPQVLKQLRDLESQEVLVGVPAEEAWRDPVPGEPREPINNAALAYIHNYGAPARNIPARPFMEPGIEEARSAITIRMSRAAEAIGTEKAEPVANTLHAVGLIAQAAIRRKITTGPFAPLSPRTIARRRKGRGPTFTVKPLIDTGQMRFAINYVIRPRGGGD